MSFGRNEPSWVRSMVLRFVRLSPWESGYASRLTCILLNVARTTAGVIMTDSQCNVNDQCREKKDAFCSAWRCSTRRNRRYFDWEHTRFEACISCGGCAKLAQRNHPQNADQLRVTHSSTSLSCDTSCRTGVGEFWSWSERWWSCMKLTPKIAHIGCLLLGLTIIASQRWLRSHPKPHWMSAYNFVINAAA